ncbi:MULTISPECIES: 3-deoxy-manno-octulosonate cytidylyltransferase [Tenacibaculum]|uniref:3-deoxy-manno-octulosonate cytidylyltransferase n=1 Tax=Tenacibaculum TaxID=104267 RepID=UPI001F0B23FD|nr:MULTISPECIES: 3-deoxy-manno-octulosonate cytidylyltransferase [Tenacibaculum]MCH3882911.1 3-deoxy-manno-octulosonate cytidylyltransferase [Tenacibaculum aquimarinum]MDO6600828.1 3-deoxy-manno-octulosonate cytidylyltransferase [Tenacibaculum sp. 1_MG-2023]
MKIIAMIPARYQASRFPGKLMKDLGGKSVIVRTYESAVKTNLFDEVFVVTDSDIIFSEITNAGGKVIMSTKEHECGSDRIAEAVENIDVDIVVNVQGDEPFIDEVSLQKLINAFKNDVKKEIDLASLKVELTDTLEVENPNNVKVITDVNNFAIYFSRSVIPFHRDKEIKVKYFKHKGVYAFRKKALLDFYTTPMTPLEAAEKIEAIRYLEVGKKIKMIETSVESIGIDTPEDLEKAKKLF